MKNELPALFVRGSQFTTSHSIETQLKEKFDVPPARSWHEFLQALSAAAEAYHTRIPLIIDGLNESTHNGTFSKVWELGLKGLVQEIKQTRNVVLITTCRTSYKEAIWKDEDPPNSVYAFGFNTEEVTREAIEKYFNAYKIKAALTLAPLMQFEHPLHLKIFCETKNRERKTEVQVYVGEQTLFEVFDEYLEQCNEAVCKLLDLHSGACIVQSALNEMAPYLWKHSTRHIPRNDLALIIDGKSLDELKKSASKMFAVESEGLFLVFRDMVNRTEVIRFTYDLLGGYLIAKYLLEQVDDDVQGFINSEEVVAALFSEDYQTLHPMHEDIRRCLAALTPSKTSKYLHDFTDNKIARYYSIRSLFEISPKYITADCTNKIGHIFNERSDSRKRLLELAESTVGHPNHPFNASFWSDQLSALSMVERDLSWSEHVRLYREKYEELLIRYEKTCQNHQDISELSAKRLHLLAEHIMWILTSTVRPLRDLATRALYWYGRRFPRKFFNLVLKSFTINDPYVSERMLAATYGIAMAHHNNFEKDSFIEEVLPIYGRELYENMFKSEAPHGTTHILARDYAKRTIDIALIHHPDLLTNDEKARINPPYTDGGIRKWGESENKEEGPPPVQMDFDIYTLDRLIKYDSQEPDERKRLKANVYWRIYDLGFSLDSFEEIDRRLAEDNYRKYSRSGDGRKTDRYGKKYSWIAFYELAGFRQDKGLLPDYYKDSRISDADIDPSFPDEHREYNLVTEDFLGNREITVEHWVYKTSHPNLTPYLKVDQLCKEQGPWVILRGYLSQEDKQVNRSMFAWLQGLIVKSTEVDEIVKILNRQENIDGHTVPSIPEDYRTYAGEIPWSDTFPTNGWEEFSFEIGTDIVLHEQSELLRDGEPISLYEKFQFWHSEPDLIEKDDEEILKARLSEQNLEIEIKMVEVEQPKYQQFETLVPVRDNCWEESCSAANPHRSIAIPAREIADSLDLHGHPQSFDLFEKVNSKRASISFRDGEIWGNVQHFTYLRKDLLERYLAEIDAEIIWVIWGNRRQVSQNINDPYENFQEVKTYRDIRKTSRDS